MGEIKINVFDGSAPLVAFSSRVQTYQTMLLLFVYYSLRIRVICMVNPKMLNASLAIYSTLNTV